MIDTGRTLFGSNGMVNLNAYRPVLNELNVNATLREEEWKEIDQAVVKAFQDRLVGIADLYANNLIYKISDGMSRTVLEYETESDFTDAELSMDGASRSNADRPNYEVVALPLPIIHKDFRFNARVLAASRRLGQPLDVASAELAARKVAEYAEDLLFNGKDNLTHGGGTIYGYEDYPNLTSTSFTDATWTNSGVSGEEMLTDIRNLKQALINDKRYGPYMVYVPTAYETVLDGEFKTNSDRSIRERLLAVKGIQDIKVADHMSADKVIMVQMTSDVVRLVEGLPITNMEWNTEGGMIHNFKVMSIMIPQLRADQSNRSGIAVCS